MAEPTCIPPAVALGDFSQPERALIVAAIVAAAEGRKDGPRIAHLARSLGGAAESKERMLRRAKARLVACRVLSDDRGVLRFNPRHAEWSEPAGEPLIPPALAKLVAACESPIHPDSGVRVYGTMNPDKTRLHPDSGVRPPGLGSPGATGLESPHPDSGVRSPRTPIGEAHAGANCSSVVPSELTDGRTAPTPKPVGTLPGMIPAGFVMDADAIDEAEKTAREWFGPILEKSGREALMTSIVAAARKAAGRHAKDHWRAALAMTARWMADGGMDRQPAFHIANFARKYEQGGVDPEALGIVAEFDKPPSPAPVRRSREDMMPVFTVDPNAKPKVYVPPHLRKPIFDPKLGLAGMARLREAAAS